MRIHPDVELKVAETDLAFRLGLVTRDAKGKTWGVTARHVFRGLSSATILTSGGEPLSAFRVDENEEVSADAADVSLQLVRFSIAEGHISPKSVRYDVTWPREAMKPSQMLGAHAVAVASHDRIIGTIVEVDTVARISDYDGEARDFTGAALLSLDDPRLLQPGMAGSLVTAASGEAIGLAMARKLTDVGVEVVLCPLAPFLERMELRPWAPPGAHWSDLRQRVAVFERAASQELAGAWDMPRSPSIR